jgi:hypothetical protein
MKMSSGTMMTMTDPTMIPTYQYPPRGLEVLIHPLGSVLDHPGLSLGRHLGFRATGHLRVTGIHHLLTSRCTRTQVGHYVLEVSLPPSILIA